MVNSKNVAFKVDKQAPNMGPPPLPYATVINCRRPRGKKTQKGRDEVRSQQVPVPAVLRSQLDDERKRKREDDDVDGDTEGGSRSQSGSRGQSPASSTNSVFQYPRTFPNQRPQLSKPTRFRRGKLLTKEIDLDSWFTILTFSDPAQLLEMRTKIASCYRFLRDNPMLWKHSRSYYYGNTLPDPPSELSEFQYAHLRHGHGCMSCGTPSTRKTYWAFLRRWCKVCVQQKTMREHDALALFKGANGEDISYIQRCLSSGVIDSWGNFVGVGPAQTHSLKTVYLASDVHKLVNEYHRESQDNRVSWHAEMRTWLGNKQKVVDERREFAKKMEAWEDNSRASKSFDYQGRKDARKSYYVEKAAKLTPPILSRELDQCPAFRRAIAIPKEPSITSWLALLPKLEKEVIDVRLAEERKAQNPSSQHGLSGPQHGHPSCPHSGSSNPHHTHHMHHIHPSSQAHTLPNLPHGLPSIQHGPGPSNPQHQHQHQHQHHQLPNITHQHQPQQHQHPHLHHHLPDISYLTSFNPSLPDSDMF